MLLVIRMTKEEEYIRYKKMGLLEHISSYNKKLSNPYQFQLNPDNFDIEKYLCRQSQCQHCGSCCQTFPCVFAPADFLDIENMDYMREILNTGLLCLSKVYNSTTTVIRPRGRGDLGIVSFLDEIKYTYDGSNPCILYSSNGCLLSSEYRPSQGLLYMPTTYSHIRMYTDEDIEKEYSAYQKILFDLFVEYVGIDNYPNITEENVHKLIRCISGVKE